MRSISYYIITLLITIFFVPLSGVSTHLAGGQINYKYVSPGKYEITMEIYRDCSGNASALWDTTSKTVRLINACGSQNYNNVPGGQRFSLSFVGYSEASVICPSAKTTCNGGTTRGINKYTWKSTITIPSSASCAKGYYIAYNRQNRDNGIGNISNGQAFWIESFMDTSIVNNNSSAVFSSDPMPYACIGQNVSLSFGASDPDGDSLDFYLTDARKLGTGGAPTSVQYRFGFDGEKPIAGVNKNSINAKTGDLTFTAPNVAGNYVVVVAIDEYKKGTTTSHSTIYRDFQIYFDACSGNSVPIIVSGGVTNITGGGKVDSTTVQSKIGKIVCWEVPFSDANSGDTVTITSNASTILPGTVTQSTIGVNAASRKVCWTIPITSLASYNVSFFAKDNNCPVSGSASMTTTIKLAEKLANVSISGVKETCFKSNDGNLTANHVGGIGPFNYKWDSSGVRISANTKNLINIPANISYTVWVIDSFDFDSIKSTGFNLAQTLPVSIAAASPINIGCDGGCTGEIKITSVTGGNTSTPGVNGYGYKWSGSADTTTNPKNLCAGTHLVTISDDRNCDTVYSFFISQPPVVQVDMIDSVMVSCKGGSDGSAKSSAKTIECGVYGTLATKCATTSAATIGTGIAFNTFTGFPTPFGTSTGAKQQYLYLASELKTAGFSKGRISAINFDYQSTFQTVFKEYSLSIGCTDSTNLDNGFINSGFQVYSANTHTFSVTDLTSGSPKVTFAQEFEWDGNSNVVVTVCFSKSATFNAQMKHSTTSFNSVAYFTSDTSNACVSDTATFIVKTRPNIKFQYCEPGLSYSWNTSPVQTADSAKTLTAGTYNVVATNLAGCKDTATVTITEPLLGLVLASTTIKNLDCNADTNGSVSVQVRGGTPGFTFKWPIGVLTSSDSIAINLKGGIKYTVTVTDTKGCFDTVSVQLTDPVAMTFGSSVVTAVSCKNGNDGSITVVTAGGTPPYLNYTWTGTSSISAIANSLIAGSYKVIVEDSKGCEKDTTFIISEPLTGLGGTLTVTKTVTCKGGNDGEASVVPTGGTPNYTYLWSQGTPGTPPTSVTGLSAPSVSVTISDSKGCKDTLTQTVGEPATGVGGTLTVTKIVSCKGGNDGEASVVATGGTPNYTYVWSQGTPGTPPSSVTGLSAPSVSVIISDSKGCKDTLTQTVGEPLTGVGGTLTVTKAVSCKGGSDGEANVVASGGTAGYTYIWSQGTPGTPPSSVNGLSAPSVSVTISDSKGCKDTLTQTVSEPAFGMTSSMVILDSIKCKGGNDGRVSVTPSGGTSPYTYNWSAGSGTSTDSISGVLSVGKVIVTITATGGCTTKDSLTLTEPATIISGSFVSKVNPTCTGSGNDGSIKISVSGGVGSYTYAWTASGTSPGGSTDSTRINMTAGSFSVLVTDAKGCAKTFSDTLVSPGSMSVSFTVITEPTCYGDTNGTVTATPVGGTGTLTYLWTVNRGKIGSSDSIWINADTGSVKVEITDSLGCKASAVVNLTQPDSILINVNILNNVLCAGDSSGQVRAILSGGTGGYTYNWNGIGIAVTGADSMRQNIWAGTFNLDITDSKGCKNTKSYKVSQPASAITGTTFATSVLCFNSTNGVGRIVASGGTTPYTYNWSSGTGTSTDSVSSSIPAGPFTVTVIDKGGCTKLFTDTILAPDTLKGSFTVINNPGCGSGGALGSVTLTPTGGTPGFTYNWIGGGINGSSDSIRINIPPGMIKVVITDKNGCPSDTISRNLSAPGNMSPTFSNIKDPLCIGDSSGSLTVTPNGGTSPYVFTWNMGALGSSDSIRNNLPGGVQIEAYIRDSSGCLDTAKITLNNPNAVQISFTDSTLPVCSGDTNGTIRVTAIGGLKPYTYLWSNGDKDSLANNVKGNTKYIVTVNDRNGCIAKDSLTISDPTPMTASFTDSASITCNGGANGSLTLTPSGGVLLYSYSWTASNSSTVSTGSSDSIATGLLGNVLYSVTVTDGKGCKASASKSLVEPQAITFQAFGGAAVCGTNNGRGRIFFIRGGTPTYTYAWDSAGTVIGTGLTINGLWPGLYTVTVTDSKGCSASRNVNIGNRGAPIILLDSITDVFCDGVCNGAINVRIISNDPPLTYNWSNSDTTEDVKNLCAGLYSITVTDTNSCIRVRNFTVDIIDTLEVTMSTTPMACNSTGCTGVATATPITSTGTSPFRYKWSTSANDTLTTVSNLCAGNYKVTVTDAKGCTVKDSAIILNPSNIVITSTQDSVTCNSGTDGAARVTGITGGASPFKYVWSTSVNDTFSIKSGLGAGIYFVTVSESGGCSKVDTVVVLEPTGMSSSFVSTDANCGQSDAKTTITVSGGKLPYGYTWPVGGIKTSNTDSGYSAGAQNVLVTDGKGCSQTFPFPINNINGPVITFDSIKHETCLGNCDGGIFISATGGTPSYTYNWLPGSSSSQDLVSACPGSYDLRVTDSKNCITIYSDTIEASTLVVPNVFVINHASAKGACDGIAKVTPSGGMPIYSFRWSSGSISDTANSLCAGKHYVTVTDSNGCKGIDSIIITEPLNLVLDSVQMKEATCQKVPCDGRMKIFVSGGSGTYTYLWDNGDITDETINRCAGVLSVTVSDGSIVDTFRIPLSETKSSVIGTGLGQSISCNGGNDGKVFAFVISGQPITTWLWSPSGGTADTANNLSAGVYTISATNNFGCDSYDTITLIDPTPLLTTSDTISPNCGAADGKIIALVSGGTGPYSIQWLDASMNALVPSQIGDTAKNISSGIYNYRVTDKNNCTSTLQVTLSDKNAPIIKLDSTRAVTCFGICDGGIFITATGGTGTLSYLWSPGSKSTTDLDSACAGVYSVKITDSLGCSSILQDTVGAASALTINVTKLSDVSTSSACDGAASVIVSGGTPVYKFTWTSGGTASVANNLCKGMNKVTVTDSKGCSGVDSVLILEPNVLILTKVDTTQPACGLCDGKIKIAVSGGTAPYTYKWDNGDSADSTLNRCAGVIRVTVSDKGSLSQVFNIGLNSSNAPNITMVVMDASCNGVCDGSATATASAGAFPYSYTWPSLGASGPSITSKCAGVYLVEVRDSKGCIATDSANIKEPTKILANVNVTMSDCGVSNGMATVSAVGGITPYKYKWSSGSTTTTPVLTGIGAGAYFVTVEDTSLCSVVLPFAIVNPNGPTILIDRVVDEVCNNSCDGGIFITASGTSGPYSYKWNPGGIISEDLNNQCAGIYTVEVTDSNKCISVATDTIKGPPAPQQTIILVNNASAFGKCDGKAYITIPGGSTGYNFQWTSSEVGDTTKALCAGINYVTITNAQGCQFIDSILITQPQKLIITGKKMVNPNCNVCDGKVSVTVAGGTSPYSYKWDNGDVADSTTKRCAGIAFLTVTDSKNYSEVFKIGLSNSTAPSLSSTKKNATCANSCNGEITVKGTGTVSPYTYNWPTLGIRKDTVFGLCADTYFVEVKDKVGCVAVQSFDITAPNAIQFNFTKVLPQCGINTGMIVSTINGGTPKSNGYDYSWLDELQFAIVPAQRGDRLINVGAGLYHLAVTDSLGCIDTATVTINNIGGVSIKLDSLRNASCSGLCDGEISITASSSLVTYRWMPSTDTTSSVNGLCAGSHTIEVTDTFKCKSLNTFTIKAPSALKIVARSVTDATCSNTNDGKIVTLINDPGKITYQWNGVDSFASNLANALNILPGTYNLFATNELGCTDSMTTKVGVRVDYGLTASGDSAYCGSQLVPLYANVTSSGFYVTTWYDGNGVNMGQRDSISLTPPKGTTKYVVEVRQEVCVQYDTVTIVIDDVYLLSAGKNRTIVKGQRTTLGGKPTAPTGRNVVWTPNISLDNANTMNPVATPEETITYIASSGIEGGCLVKDTVEVIVDDKIKINDAFSPNGDGVNDKWEIGILQDYPNAKVQIFNRWGQLLYESQPYDAWDGTYKGKDMPLGTYYYIIDLNDGGSTQTLSGAITIIR